MTLIKTSLLNAIAVTIKVFTLLGLNKVLAIYVGPAGYAAIGNLQNALQMLTTFAGGSISNGVVKYTAEYYDNELKQRLVWRTAGTISLFGSIINGLFISIFSRQISQWFLKDEKFSSVFIWFSITLVFFVFNTLLLAILNGKKEIHYYISANIAGSIFSVIITSLLAMKLGLYGALTALAIYPSLSFIITLIICYKTDWFKFSYLLGKINKETTINLSKYIIMALTSAACVPVSHILVRNHLGATFGWNSAGYWEAIWRLSTAYLMLITTTLSLYYLPRLSEIKKIKDLKTEIMKCYKIILPLVATCGIAMFLLRDFIIELLFTADFAPMRELFALQMIGDIFKIGSWLLSFVLVSRAMIKIFVVTEVLFSLIFIALTYLFTKKFGLEGVILAYTINYALYWLAMSIIIKQTVFKYTDNSYV